MTPFAFASALLALGIELILRNGRLHVWPARAYKHLSDAERDFIHAHRAELKALAAAKALPETTVVWQPPTEAAIEPPTPEPPCPYCGRVPCIGPTHHAYDVLHYDDPEHVERRRKAATAEMLVGLRRARYEDPYVR